MNELQKIQLDQAGSDAAYRDWADYGLEFLRDTVGMLSPGPFRDAYQRVVTFLSRNEKAS